MTTTSFLMTMRTVNVEVYFPVLPRCDPAKKVAAIVTTTPTMMTTMAKVDPQRPHAGSDGKNAEQIDSTCADSTVQTISLVEAGTVYAEAAALLLLLLLLLYQRQDSAEPHQPSSCWNKQGRYPWTGCNESI
jgi:hypothetical protein